MKRTIITFCLLLAASLVWAQEIHTAEYFELNTPIPSAESHEYQAASQIMLTAGFHSKPDPGQQVMLNVNRNLITMDWYYENQNDDGSNTFQKRKTYYGYLRHQGENTSSSTYSAYEWDDLPTASSGNVPMNFSVVRNNIYRISIDKITEDNTMEMKIKVKKWDKFTHEVIYM